MRLLQRLKMAFNPKSHSSTLSHYIPSVNYADDPVMNSVWRSDLEKRLTDWRGDTGRVYNQQVLTSQGHLMSTLKTVKAAGIGGNNFSFGQNVTVPVTGFAGRPAQLTAVSDAAEFVQVNQ